MTEFFTEYGYLVKPLATGTLVSVVCSVLGCFIILRRMSFLADAIAHSMLAGVIAGYLIVKMVIGGEAETGSMLLGAIIAGIITVGMVGFVTRFSRLKEDTAIGIMYTGIFAVGSLVLSLEMFGQYVHIDIYHYIVGSIVSANAAKLWLSAIVAAIVLSVVVLFYRPLQLTSFDPVMAASIGIPVLAVDYLLTTCTSLVVVCGVQIAGVILVVAMIITPAASAYLLSDRLDRMIVLSAALGASGFWIGFFVAGAIGASAGASVVVTMTAMFLLCLIFAPRYGLVADWIRKANTVPQEIMEDVLGAVLRNDAKKMPINEVLTHVKNPNARIRKAIVSLSRQGMLEINGDVITLTEEGEFHANQLIRAHRLWETYLDRTRTPKTEIHDRAHILEHISDPATVEYLDDKLGHPLTDPHGTAIPASVNYEKGPILASLLREGHQAKIVRIATSAQPLNLSCGEVISMAKRRNDGETWVVVKSDGSEIELTHKEADDVTVELIAAEN